MSKNKISYFKPQFLGESPADVSNRVWKAIDFIKERTENTEIRNVFIFAHSNINKCILMNILNLPPEFYDDFKIEKDISIIRLKNGKLDIDNIENF